MFDISLFSQKRSSQSDPMPKTIALSNCNNVYTTGLSDHLFYLNLGPHDRCIGIFDGNGECSKDYAQISGNFFMESLQDEWAKIKQYTLDNNNKQIIKLLRSIFDTTDEYLDIKLSNEGGGATALILGLFYENDTIYTFSANVGNSACILYTNNEIKHLWEEHIPDNISEWERYCKKTSASKRKQFVYNKINVYDNGRPLGPIVSKINRPIPIFQYKNKTASVIKENIALLRETNIPLGGNNSVRRHLITTPEGDKIVDPEFAHKNTGATVDGKINLTRTLGNFKLRANCYLDAEPSIFLNTIEDDSVIVMGTDGFFNLWRYEDIRDLINKTTLKSHEYVQLLYNKTLETARDENLNLFQNKYPLWDDVTYVVIKINKNNVNALSNTINNQMVTFADTPIIQKISNKNNKNNKNNKRKQKSNNTLKREARRRRKRRQRRNK